MTVNESPSAEEMAPAVEPEEAVEEANVVSEADAIIAALSARMGTLGTKQTKLKMLIFGGPGSGKTTFAAHPSVDGMKILFIDVERGTASLVGGEGVVPENVTVLEYKSFRQIELLTQALANGEFPEYDIIVLDSLSELSRKGLAEVTDREHFKSGGLRNRYTAETSDYSENNEHIRRIVDSLRDLDRHLICTSHTRQKEDKRTGLTFKQADFSPAMAQTFNGIFDVVGMLSFDAEEGTRELQVQPSIDVTAKTRVKGLDPVIENPSWNEIYATFRKQHNL